MTMQRRGFLGAMLAACAAPAYVKAGSLMRVVAPPAGLWVPRWTEQSLREAILNIYQEPTPFVTLHGAWRKPVYEWRSDL